MKKEIVIIGAGAAGMMAAITASENKNNNITIIERNEKAGKKLYITGKGRCNITNAADMSEWDEFIKRNYKFLYSSFAALDNISLINMLNDFGLKTKLERGKRIFPASDKASEVVKTFESKLKKLNIKFVFNERVTAISCKNGYANFVKTDKNNYKCDSVIICTGGKSYPTTGSTGDGYMLAKTLGHDLVKAEAALVPLIVSDEDVKSLTGLTLKNVTLTAKKGKKIIYSDIGELLFTHFGVSGPMALSLSSSIDINKINELEVYIDFKPGLKIEQLDLRIQRDFEKYINKDLSNALVDLLPKALIEIIIKRAGLKSNDKPNEITKVQRNSLVQVLKYFKLNIIGLKPIEEGIITRGGVNVNNIDSKTMRSKIVPNVYFAGEVIDVDGLTGGFNLQIAFSTGFVAGKNA